MQQNSESKKDSFHRLRVLSYTYGDSAWCIRKFAAKRKHLICFISFHYIHFFLEGGYVKQAQDKKEQ